jgi:hypothetical protein
MSVIIFIKESIIFSTCRLHFPKFQFLAFFPSTFYTSRNVFIEGKAQLWVQKIYDKRLISFYRLRKIFSGTGKVIDFAILMMLFKL